MARVAKFRFDTTDLDIDFDGGVWHIESWVPKASSAGEDVQETPTVLIVTASDDLMAAQIQLLDDLILRVDRYRENPAYETPVWLHAKRNLETGERRSIVKHLSYTPLNSEFDCEAMQYQSQYQLNITRGGWWEDPTGQQYGGLAAVAGASIEWDYTGPVTVPAHDVLGDVPARIGLLSTVENNGCDKLYAGIRSANVRQIANFEGEWECEDGTNTAISADDAASEVNTASPGAGAGVLVIGTPTASNTWEEYLGIQLANVYGAWADYDAAFGTFLWLLRCKATTAANVFQVQLRWGYDGMGAADYIRGPIVEVSNTAWDYAEMGVQKLPLSDRKIAGAGAFSVGTEAVTEVQIWAARTAGAGTIKFDCLCPIAVDEGYLAIRDAAATATNLLYGKAPDGHEGAFSYSSGAAHILRVASMNAGNFGLPPGDGRMDIVFTRDGSSVLTDTLTITSTSATLYYESWRSLRGTE